ncbi:MAG: PDZ domain-containing protein, partial [Xanthomonadales bacterium]|nr:PDZ domain-containing protein [Xanthomonadales bacterium]
GKSGEIYYIETQGHASFASFEGPGELKRFTLEARDASTMMSDVSAFELSADGEKVLYNKGSSWFVSAVGDELKPGKGKLDLDAIVVNADPRAEWAQIFNEAWRINRDWFYDPNFHGADWPAMREKYAQFLPHLASREDLDRVIRWMLSELSVGHSYLTPGEYPNGPEPVPVGLLGADYEVDQGRYRFAKIYGGLNWNADLHAPLRKAGVEVNEGDYLIAVNGREVKAPDNLYHAFMNQVGRQVSIKVADNPAGRDAREYTVLPVARETSLRYLDWLEGNLRYVNEKTDGRVAYVHVPNTADYGYEMFKRYFYPQSHKDAIIVDERYNGGGLIADYYIDILRREYISHWNFRYGNDLKSPRGSIQGPKVMLADEGAGSGGDLLPWMFKKFNMGPVIGKRTWGGLVGILGFPPLMDGGSVTAPNLGFWTEDGFRVENEGVAPDIEVEQWPADVNAGRDPQLDKAIEVILNALEEEPPVAPQRPDYPVRVYQH